MLLHLSLHIFHQPFANKFIKEPIQWLRPGGKIILEAFNPNQLNNHSGGPKEISMLYTEDMIRNDFEGLDIEILQSVRTILNEGKYHEGIADVIQFVGTRKIQQFTEKHKCQVSIQHLICNILYTAISHSPYNALSAGAFHHPWQALA